MQPRNIGFYALLAAILLLPTAAVIVPPALTSKNITQVSSVRPETNPCGPRSLEHPLVCDPDRILTRMQAYSLQTLLRDIGNGDKPQFYGSMQCGTKTVGLKLALVIEYGDDDVTPMHGLRKDVPSRNWPDSLPVGDAGCRNGIVLVVVLREQRIFLTARADSSAISQAALDRHAQTLRMAADEMIRFIDYGWLELALAHGIMKISKTITTPLHEKAILGLVPRGPLRILESLRGNLLDALMSRGDSIYLVVILLSVAVALVICDIVRLIHHLYLRWHRSQVRASALRRIITELGPKQKEIRCVFESNECSLCLEALTPTKASGLNSQPRISYDITGNSALVDSIGRTTGASLANPNMKGLRNVMLCSSMDDDDGPEASPSTKLTLTCGHSFHNGCIHSLVGSYHFSCPLCRKELFCDDPWQTTDCGCIPQ